MGLGLVARDSKNKLMKCGFRNKLYVIIRLSGGLKLN